MAYQWSVDIDEEALHRQGLFRKARKGDKRANQELQETYGVRLFSEQERSKLVYTTPQPKTKHGKRKAKIS